MGAVIRIERMPGRAYCLISSWCTVACTVHSSALQGTTSASLLKWSIPENIHVYIFSVIQIFRWSTGKQSLKIPLTLIFRVDGITLFEVVFLRRCTRSNLWFQGTLMFWPVVNFLSKVTFSLWPIHPKVWRCHRTISDWNRWGVNIMYFKVHSTWSLKERHAHRALIVNEHLLFSIP